MQSIQLAIARRAYELFQMRNGEHGHDWEDWFQAESELLRPVSTTVSESADRLSIRANVFGFEADEIKVSIEPTRIAILGQRRTRPCVPPDASATSADFYPDQILRLIDISSDVDPDSAVVELRSGILIFELTKTAKREAKVPAVA
jgi:HSP20 family molecular chaperone IbpA